MARGIKFAKLRKIGNSYGIIITKAELRALGIPKEALAKKNVGLKIIFEPIYFKK